jgi:hypothetical protein
LEFTFVEDRDGTVVVPIPGREVVWTAEPLGEDERSLSGVRARVIPLELLRDGKQRAREAPGRRQRTSPISPRSPTSSVSSATSRPLWAYRFALRAGLPVLGASRFVGTSIAMIDRHQGHPADARIGVGRLTITLAAVLLSYGDR